VTFCIVNGGGRIESFLNRRKCCVDSGTKPTGFCPQDRRLVSRIPSICSWIGHGVPQTECRYFTNRAGKFKLGAMREKKRIVFYYDGEVREHDTVVDPSGEAVVPENGQVIKKHGQPWRVTYVQRQGGNGAYEYGIYKIYLARA
jgi:hypothetical protein